jgi:hypothetical protein
MKMCPSFLYILSDFEKFGAINVRGMTPKFWRTAVGLCSVDVGKGPSELGLCSVDVGKDPSELGLCSVDVGKDPSELGLCSGKDPSELGLCSGKGPSEGTINNKTIHYYPVITPVKADSLSNSTNLHNYVTNQ